MRKRNRRKAVLWLAPGCLLWLSCPSGTGQFLAPIVQPVLSQFLTDLAATLTDNLLGQSQAP